MEYQNQQLQVAIQQLADGKKTPNFLTRLLEANTPTILSSKQERTKPYQKRAGEEEASRSYSEQGALRLLANAEEMCEHLQEQGKESTIRMRREMGEVLGR